MCIFWRISEIEHGTLVYNHMKSIFIRFWILLLAIFIGQAFTFAEVNPTQSPTCVALTYNIVLGGKDLQTNGQVTSLQMFLRAKGYLSSNPTGYFGNMTKKAVQSFQNENGITPNGSVGPYTRAKVKALSCTLATTTSSTTIIATESTSQVVPAPVSIPVTTTTVVSYAPYQGYVDGRIQIDASSVSKEYAYTSCKKLITDNSSNSIKCLWNGVGLLSYISTTTTVDSSVSISQVASSAPVIPTVSFVKLLINPTSVPYKGGYDSFELKSEGMASCTLYFKDEPSNSWTSGGSTLGVNYVLPGYKGMTKSRSYYSSCKDKAGKTLDSDTVLIMVSQSTGTN